MSMGRFVSPGVLLRGVTTPNGVSVPNLPQITQEFLQFSKSERKVFHAIADAFLKNPQNFEKKIRRHISAYKIELGGKPLLRAEVRDLYLRTLPCLPSEMERNFILTLDNALYRAQEAGDLRSYDKDPIEFMVEKLGRIFAPICQSIGWLETPAQLSTARAQEKKQETVPRDTRAKIVLLIGPRTKKEIVDKVISETRKQDPHALIIGNGIEPTAEEHLRGSIHPDAHVHILAHGVKVNGIHYSDFFKETRPTAVLFNRVGKMLGEKFRGVVFFRACHGEAAASNAGFLPTKATLITSVDAGQEMRETTLLRESIYALTQYPQRIMLLSPDTLVFASNAHQVTCRIPIAYTPHKTPKELKQHLVNYLQNCAIPEIRAAVKNLKISHDDFRKYRQEAFFLQVERGNVKYVKQCVEEGFIDPNEPNLTGVTALFSAIERGDEEMVQSLVRYEKTDVNYVAASQMGMTPLLYAVRVGKVEMVKILANEKRTNPNIAATSIGVTPLMGAASFGNQEMVRAILNNTNTDPMIRTSSGETALMVAEQQGHHAIARDIKSAIQHAIARDIKSAIQKRLTQIGGQSR